MNIHAPGTLLDLEPSRAEFRDAVLSGLSSGTKTIPCKFLYDVVGSRLFDRICDLPEYYPTRTECGLLSLYGDRIAEFAGSRASLVEFGSGSSVKVRLLLLALNQPASYVPIDISREHLMQATTALAQDFPNLSISPVCADYSALEALPSSSIRGSGRRIGFFPGSTIGNFSPQDAGEFLHLVKRLLGPNSLMIVGVDTPKNRSTLEAAYDDAEGVTAAFNLNLLARVNRELDGDFDLTAFRHQAIWNERESRVEMHLISASKQVVHVAGRRFGFTEGETIHTESSYKYAPDCFQTLARNAGYCPRAVWTDEEGQFSIHLLEIAS